MESNLTAPFEEEVPPEGQINYSPYLDTVVEFRGRGTRDNYKTYKGKYKYNKWRNKSNPHRGTQQEIIYFLITIVVKLLPPPWLLQGASRRVFFLSLTHSVSHSNTWQTHILLDLFSSDMVSRACNKTFIRLRKDIELSKYRGKTARHPLELCVFVVQQTTIRNCHFLGDATDWRSRNRRRTLHDKTFPIARWDSLFPRGH